MVRIKDLPNKPLIEAIFEMRWQVDPEKGDPNYSLFIGRLYDQLLSVYPFHEPLQTSMIPEIMAGSIAQHRFRVEEKQWPLIQVGPGLVTLNDTEKYSWADFNQRVNTVIKAVFKAYPKPKELKVTNLVLRYIDGIIIDDISQNTFQFLKDKLKVNLHVPETLYEDVNVEKEAHSFSFTLNHNTKSPRGIVNLKFSSGRIKGKKAIIMEIIVQSTVDDLPTLPRGFNSWLKSAHGITDDWFFKLIEGDLEREYSGNTKS